MNNVSDLLLVLGRILSQYIEDDVTIELSKYRVKTEHFDAGRCIIQMQAKDFSRESVMQLLSTLNSNQELALNSRVLINGTLMHIPMVDFVAMPDFEYLKFISGYLGEDILENYLILSSGRSYHGYGSNLVTPDEWVKLMGKLLLLNKNAEPPTTDIRWIGYRLVAGYSALRWSCNTKEYQSAPKIVSKIHNNALLPI